MAAKKVQPVMIYPNRERAELARRALLESRRVPMLDAINLVFHGATMTVREPGTYRLKVTGLGFVAELKKKGKQK